MKRVSNFIMSLLISLALFPGCKADKPQDLIVKKWAITDVKVGGEEKMSDQEKQIMLKLEMDFTKDGKLIVTGLPQGTKTGSYSLSEDGKTLTTTDPGGNSTPNDVSTITKNKLVFKNPKDGLTFTLESK
ncbi:MAG: lipocalin family protein [Chitinophagaceae bacterium]